MSQCVSVCFLGLLGFSGCNNTAGPTQIHHKLSVPQPLLPPLLQVIKSVKTNFNSSKYLYGLGVHYCEIKIIDTLSHTK